MSSKSSLRNRIAAVITAIALALIGIQPASANAPVTNNATVYNAYKVSMAAIEKSGVVNTLNLSQLPGTVVLSINNPLATEIPANYSVSVAALNYYQFGRSYPADKYSAAQNFYSGGNTGFGLSILEPMINPEAYGTEIGGTTVPSMVNSSNFDTFVLTSYDQVAIDGNHFVITERANNEQSPNETGTPVYYENVLRITLEAKRVKHVEMSTDAYTDNTYTSTTGSDASSMTMDFDYTAKKVKSAWTTALNGAYKTWYNSAKKATWQALNKAFLASEAKAKKLGVTETATDNDPTAPETSSSVFSPKLKGWFKVAQTSGATDTLEFSDSMKTFANLWANTINAHTTAASPLTYNKKTRVYSGENAMGSFTITVDKTGIITDYTYSQISDYGDVYDYTGKFKYSADAGLTTKWIKPGVGSKLFMIDAFNDWLNNGTVENGTVEVTSTAVVMHYSTWDSTFNFVTYGMNSATAQAELTLLKIPFTVTP